jgi:hypothetical protein
MPASRCCRCGFSGRAFSLGTAASFQFYASMYAVVFFLPQFFQTGQGHGLLDVGLRLLPWTATLFVFAPLGGSLVNRVAARRLGAPGYHAGGLAACERRGNVGGARLLAGQLGGQARSLARRISDSGCCSEGCRARWKLCECETWTSWRAAIGRNRFGDAGSRILLARPDCRARRCPCLSCFPR